MFRRLKNVKPRVSVGNRSRKEIKARLLADSGDASPIEGVDLEHMQVEGGEVLVHRGVPRLVAVGATWMPTVQYLVDHCDWGKGRCVVVNSGVSRAILRGAKTLYAPGCMSVPDVTAGTPVCLRVVRNPTPFAVGIWGAGEGAVSIVHSYNDALWEFKPCPDFDNPLFSLYQVLSPEWASEDAHLLGNSVSGNNTTTDEEKVTDVDVSDEVEAYVFDAEVVDRLVLSALPAALHDATLPLDTSVLWSSIRHEAPNVQRSKPFLEELSSLPNDVVRQIRQGDLSIDCALKSTSWKKLSKLIAYLVDVKLVKSKEICGVLKITFINANHDLVSGFVPSEKVAPKSAQSPKIRVEIKLVPTARCKPIFAGAKCPFVKGTPMTQAEARAILDTYMRTIVSPETSPYVEGGLVVINDTVKDWFSKKELALFTNMRQIPVTTLHNKWRSLFTPTTFLFDVHGRLIKRLNGTPIVDIIEERRAGHDVTRIRGVEQFGLDISEVKKAISKKTASSATTDRAPGRKVDDILLMGHGGKAVIAFLENGFGLPSHFVKVKLAKKPKKR